MSIDICFRNVVLAKSRLQGRFWGRYGNDAENHGESDISIEIVRNSTKKFQNYEHFENFNFLDSYSVFKKYPSSIHIKIKYTTPIATTITNGKKFYSFKRRPHKFKK